MGVSTAPPFAENSPLERGPRQASRRTRKATVTNKGTILVVDDDRLVLATLTHGLARAGYDVIDADNGDDAILLAREHRPELALLDIRMEGKSGFEVAAYLRQSLHIPFMFLSAFSDDATVAQVHALGAVAYLVKPLDIHQIVPAVEAAFADIQTRRAAGATPLPPEPQPIELPMDTTVALAVGVLMQRDSLARGAALMRLAQLAEADHVSLLGQAERLLDALEQSAGPTP